MKEEYLTHSQVQYILANTFKATLRTDGLRHWGRLRNPPSFGVEPPPRPAGRTETPGYPCNCPACRELRNIARSCGLPLIVMGFEEPEKPESQ